MSDQIVIYESQDGSTSLEVHLEADTVWLTQDQMAALFGRERSVITKHIGNVFKERELDEKSNVQNLHIAHSDKPIKLYNLDVIISVGYRIKSQTGTRFRQWATKILRDNLVKGFTVNKARLAEKGLAEMRQTVELLARTLTNQELVSETGKDVLSVIVGYAKRGGYSCSMTRTPCHCRKDADLPEGFLVMTLPARLSLNLRWS